MLEIHVTISCPDLLAAAQLLKGQTVEKKPDPAPIAPTHSDQPPFIPVTAPMSAPIAYAAAPPVAVPLASAPTFTMEQICKAGADLVTQNPGVMPQVNSLLAQYGAQTVTDLKPEHFGAVATALRGLGAKI